MQCQPQSHLANTCCIETFHEKVQNGKILPMFACSNNLGECSCAPCKPCHDCARTTIAAADLWEQRTNTEKHAPQHHCTNASCPSCCMHVQRLNTLQSLPFPCCFCLEFFSHSEIWQRRMLFHGMSQNGFVSKHARQEQHDD